MGHTLTLDMPQDIYEPLVKTAQQTGHTPEELATEWLAAAVHSATRDPLENFIGTIRSDVPGWADQHDQHIGQSLVDQLRDEDQGN